MAYYAVAGVVLLAQVVFFRTMQPPADVPLKQPLASLPSQIGNWTAVRESPLDVAVAEVLRADDTLNRDYSIASQRNGVNLFIAYFRSQQRGRWVHSPQHCLPGAGWEPVSLSSITVPIAGRSTPVAVNRYIVSRGDARAAVLYWYEVGDRVVADEYLLKTYLVLDSIRYGRSSTSLVRVTVASAGEEADAAAVAEAVTFVQAAFAPVRRLLAP
jgi:EpsI family protein